MVNPHVRKRLKEIPTAPGVYQFFDGAGNILYIGKARNLRHRVPSYFLRSNLDRGPRIAHLVDNITDIRWEVTDSEIEALLLEARLIRQYTPKYNIEWRDDKTYLYIMIDLRTDFPQIRLVRKSEVGKHKKAHYFGPYTSSRALRLALKFIRKLLPYCEYSFSKGRQTAVGGRSSAGAWFQKPCLYYHLGLCPGVCAGEMSLPDYKRQVGKILYFFEGKKEKVIAELEREMKRMAKEKKFEQAARLRDRYLSLYHLKDISLMRGAFEEKTMAQKGSIPHRIEAYDISNIFGKFAVGAMVVFIDGQPTGSEYKKFKIKTVSGISDIGALVEVLRRRFRHSNLAINHKQLAISRDQREPWPLPNLIVIDGGKPQLNATMKVLTEYGAQIAVLAVAKGRKRKRADQYYYGPGRFDDERLLRRIRDEAHRFAISYYRTLHRKAFLAKT